MCGGSIGGVVGGLAGSLFGGSGAGILGSALGGALLGGKKKSASGPDPAAEQRKKEVEALNAANVQTAMRRRALRDQSLFTGAGESAPGSNTLGVGG